MLTTKSWVFQQNQITDTSLIKLNNIKDINIDDVKHYTVLIVLESIMQFLQEVSGTPHQSYIVL